MAIKPIQILINAKDNASAVFTGLQAKVVAVGSVIASYFGIEAFKGVVKSAADLEEAMSRVQAATDGSAEEMAALKKAAEDAGASTKFTSVEAANALENLAKAGLSATDAVAALPAVLNLAQAADIGLAEASEIVTKSVMGMAEKFDQAGRYADVLAKGANATNTSVTGLGEALSYTAPVAATLNMSLESTVAILGKMADAGIDASRSGTALNSILSQFSDPASKFRRELSSIGIVTNNFEDALHQLAAAGPQGQKAIQAVGLEAGPALRALLNQGMPALDELTQKLRDAQGSAAETAATMQNNLQGSLRGLASVWDAVMQTLGAPVLPAVRQAVDQLTASLRTAIADGTVAQFGQTLATGFANAWQAVKTFVEGFDVKAVIARLQEMANGAGETLAKVGEYATNASTAVQTAWHTMASGTNVVLLTIYKVGEAFSGVASNIMAAASKVYEGLSKVSFGGMSKFYAQAAKELAAASEAAWAVAEAMNEKSAQALADLETSARKAGGGFASLAQGAAASVPVIGAVAQSIEDVVDKIQRQIEEQQKAKKAAEDKRKADIEAAEAIKRLKAEYEALLSGGSIQEAADKFVELQAAMKGVASAGEDTAKAVGEAFQRLGITSTQVLKQQADNARADYEMIRQSGTASAKDIENAFRVAAQKAIEANDGVAPSWVRTQAAAAGFKVEVDAAGQATLRLKKDTENATAAMAKGYRRVADEIERIKDAKRDLQMAEQGLSGQQQLEIKELMASGQFLAASQLQERYAREKRLDDNQYSKRASMQPINQVPDDIKTIAELDAWWEQAQQAYRESNKLTSGGALGNYGLRAMQLEYQETRKALGRQTAIAEAAARSQASDAQAREVNGQGLRNEQQVQRRIVELRLNGQSLGQVQTDEAGDAALGRFMDELERGKRGF